MNNSFRLSSIVFVLIIINAIGILLRYFDLDTYFIFFGFRFQISLVLPLLIVLKSLPKDFIIDIFKRPKYKNKLSFVYLLFIPLLILFAILFLIKKINLNDPEYFYEFGLSSIIDFPIYLAWNSLQLLSFFLFLIFVSSFSKIKFFTVFLIFILFFVYGFIPLKSEAVDFFHLLSLILSASMIGILIKYFQNIYWLAIFSFSILWLNILLFGSKSELFINLIFASQYSSWEGFFSVGKEFKALILPANLLITNIFLIFCLWRKKES